MRKENIGFDLDGIICDTYPDTFAMLKKMYPNNVKGNNAHYNWEKEYNLTQDQVNKCFIECANKGLFRELPVYEDAKRALYRIARHYRIFIVTWRNYLPNAISDTLYWLDTNRIPYYRLIMTKNKFKVAEQENFKFFLDDNPTFCNRVAKTIVPTFLLRRPWNKDEKIDPLVKIVTSWEEVQKILLF